MSQDTCPRCGEADLVGGHMESTGAVRFRPNGVKFLTFHTGDIDLHAEMCHSCGLVTLVGDVQKLHSIAESRRQHHSASSTGSSSA